VKMAATYTSLTTQSPHTTQPQPLVHREGDLTDGVGGKLTTKVTISENIRQGLRSALLSQAVILSRFEQEQYSKYCERKAIPVSVVFSLSATLRRINEKQQLTTKDGKLHPLWVHELLEGSSVVYDKPKVLSPDPAIQAKLAELRTRFANEEYEKMVRNVTETKNDRWAKDTRELSGFFSQLSVGLNIIVSMATTLTAGYWIGKHMTGKTTIGIVCGLVFMIVVLFAEMWLFIIRAERLNKQLKDQNPNSKPIYLSTRPRQYGLEKKNQ